MSGAMRTLAAIACAILVVGAVVVGGLAWRLSQGPIRLDVLTPRIEAALSAPDGSTRVDIGSTSLDWDPQDRDLDVRISNLSVHGPGGATLAQIPTLAVGIAPASLVLGGAAPRWIEAIAPRIQVVREADGRLAVGLGTEPATGTANLLLGALGSGGTSGGPSALRTIGLRAGDIVFDDRASGVTWHATQVALAVRRDGSGLTVERLAFDVAPTQVVASGRIAGGSVALDATLHTLPTRLLERWWPAVVAPAMRQWVLANVSGGSVTSAQAKITGTLAQQGGPRFALGRVDGRVVFAGLDVRWRDGVPPLTGAAGIGLFSPGGWRLRLARGEVEGLDLVRAQIAPAADGGRAVTVSAAVRAPLSKVLAFLEKPTMRSAAAAPFRPGEISGGATANVLVRVPLDGGPADVTAHGDLRSVSLRRALRGRNVNARRLLFDLDGREFEMRGTITVGRAPLQLRWREALSGASRGQRVISVKGRLDAEGRQALGVDLGSWIDGPVDVHARFAPKTQGATALDVDVDLTPAAIDLPLVNLVKDVGAPGWSDARLALVGGKVAAVDAFRLQAAGASVSGRALFGPDASVRSADGTIDMPPRAENGPAGHVAIALRPAGTGSELTATSDDPGIAFRAVDSYADATGGRVKLSGNIRLGVPGVPMAATLTADRFVLKRSPLLAKVAALGSVGGVIDLLAADGVPFTQLAVTFTQRAGVINLSEGVAGSPGLALTARGTVDRAHDELGLDGTLVPNYVGLTHLVKDVPDVGGVVTTLGDERIKAIEFSASGSLADPYVTAKPATGISPVLLRDLQRLTTTPISLTGSSKRKGAAEREEADVEAVPGRKKKAGARPSTRAVRAGPDVEATTAPAKPRIRRRAPARPAARDTDTE